MHRSLTLAGLALLVACGDTAPTTTTTTDTDALGFRMDERTRALMAAAQHRLILTKHEEVPPSRSDAYGVAFVHINPNDVVEVVARIWNPGCETIVAAHIHQAPAGVNGGVVVPLFSGSIRQRTETFRSRSVVSPDLARLLRESPEQFYVNFHSVEWPRGFVRGQLGTAYPDPDPPGTPRRC